MKRDKCQRLAFGARSYMNGGYNVTKIIYIITEASLITTVLIARQVEADQLQKK